MARGNAVRFGQPTVTSLGGQRARVQAPIHIDATESTLWFEVPETAVPSDNLADAFALAALVPAMRTGLPLHIEAPVSATLLTNLNEVAAIYSMWFPEFSRIEITAAEPRDLPPRRSSERGLFFSGGVDSFHTLLSHPVPFDCLIYIDRLDTIVDDSDLIDRIRRSIRSAADSVELPLIEVTTNIKAFVAPHAEWWLHSHTVVMASVAHALAGALGACVTSADHTYEHLIRLCAHPLLIPMFSSDRMRSETFGWDTTRLEKVIALSTSPIALQHLRVCWMNQGAAFNCGRCEKCLRTMVALTLADALDRCPTFDRPLDLAALSTLVFTHGRLIEYNRESLQHARRSGRHPELEAVLGSLVERTDAYHAAERVAGDFDMAARSDQMVPVVAHHRDYLYDMLSAHHGKWLVSRVLQDLPKKIVRKVGRAGRRSARTERDSS
jgi:hypothetical protein